MEPLRLSEAQVRALRWAVGYAQPPHESKDDGRDQALRELMGLLRDNTHNAPVVLMDAPEDAPTGRML